MPTRHILLFIAITCLFSAVLFSISGANAENFNSYRSMAKDGVTEDGEWLQIIKYPDSPYVNVGDAAEFTIVVINTSTQFDMVDIEVTDELAPQCDRTFPEIESGGEEPITCRQENVQNAFTNEVVVTGRNATNNKKDTASATADIEVLQLLATIDPETSAVPVPGGDLEFTVTLTNGSSVPIILESLVSKQFGDLADAQNTKLDPNTCTNAIGRQLPADNGEYKCKFTTDISNSPGDYVFDVTATAAVKNDPAYKVSGTGETEVKIVEIISTRLTTKKPSYATGSLINLTVTIENLRPSTSIEILAMEDADIGNVTLHGNCSLPKTLNPGDPPYSCYYQQTVTAEAGDEQTYTLNVSGETNDKTPIPIADEASATITAVQPIAYLPFITPELLIPRWDTCKNALWLETNTEYAFPMDIVDAYYKFGLEKTSDITVTIEDFTPTNGQVALFKFDGVECSAKTLKEIAYNGEKSNPSRSLVGISQPPGTYFIQVVSEGQFSPSDSYILFIETE